jgi:hypothetical protein
MGQGQISTLWLFTSSNFTWHCANFDSCLPKETSFTRIPQRCFSMSFWKLGCFPPACLHLSQVPSKNPAHDVAYGISPAHTACCKIDGCLRALAATSELVTGLAGFRREPVRKIGFALSRGESSQITFLIVYVSIALPKLQLSLKHPPPARPPYLQFSHHEESIPVLL